MKEGKPRKYFVGSVWKTRNCGDLEIIAKEYGVNGGYTVRFVEDHTVIKNVNSSNILKGTIHNPNKRTVLGVGYLGQGKFTSGDGKGGHNKLYKLWFSMLCRCYDTEYLKRFPTYVGCSVDERWHNYQNFCEDIKHIKGYDLWEKEHRKYHLDKDLKTKGNKIYSKDTCEFVYYIDNIRDGLSRRASTKGKTRTVYKLYFNGEFIDEGNSEKISKIIGCSKDAVVQRAMSKKNIKGFVVNK
ncbi:MAG: hypothetical protein RSB50_06270 [Cetobacterium sp.]